MSIERQYLERIVAEYTASGSIMPELIEEIKVILELYPEYKFTAEFEEKYFDLWELAARAGC